MLRGSTFSLQQTPSVPLQLKPPDLPRRQETWASTRRLREGKARRTRGPTGPFAASGPAVAPVARSRQLGTELGRHPAPAPAGSPGAPHRSSRSAISPQRPPLPSLLPAQTPSSAGRRKAGRVVAGAVRLHRIRGRLSGPTLPPGPSPRRSRAVSLPGISLRCAPLSGAGSDTIAASSPGCQGLGRGL